MSSRVWSRCRLVGVSLTVFSQLTGLAAAAGEPELGGAMLISVPEARRLAGQQQNVLCPVRLEGTVLWASPAQDQLILHENFSDLLVEMDLRSQPRLQVGQRVVLEGTAVAGYGRLREALVDNDGLHPPLERVETIYLPAGRQPINLAWFNGPTEFMLRLVYSGPALARRRIPDTALSHEETSATNGATHWVQGLEYRCYEGNWARLPDLRGLRAVKSGTTSNFNLEVRTRDQQVGLIFSGYLDVPRPGLYSFWLASDDGSRLYIGGASLHLSVAGSAQLTSPTQITLGQKSEDCRWAEAEGLLTSVRPCPSGGFEAELSTITNRVYLEVADASGQAPRLLSQVRARGIYRSTQLAGSGRPVEAGKLLVGSWNQIEVSGYQANPARRVTKVAELRRLGAAGQLSQCPLRLEGLVLAASPAGWLALQDDSGAVLVELNLPSASLQPGQTLALEGTGAVDGLRVRLRNPALVENDGIHGLIERSGTIFLPAGKHPLHLSWFNRDGQSGLEVSYQGPDLPRQRVPANALFHAEPEASASSEIVQWSPGLTYCCYEGPWVRVPDPDLLAPVKQGIAANFDIGLASRPTEVDLEFNGFIEVPRDGLYKFWTRSDDGSRFFIGGEPPRLEVTGTKPLPAPARLAPRQLLREDQEGQWSQVEGTVTFASEDPEGLALDLSSETGPMRVQVADRAGSSPLLLLNSRIRAAGLPQITYTADGQRVAGALVTPSSKQIEFMEMAASHWADYPLVPLRSLTETNFPEPFETIVHVRGKLHALAPGEPMVLADETDQVLLETSQPPPVNDWAEVQVLGRLGGAGGKVVLQCGYYRELAHNAEEGVNALPLLTTIEQVKSLSREEAGRRYPVHIRGIITTTLGGGFFIQDPTWAIYVRWPEATNTTMQVGDYWEVEGETFAEFAPNIYANRAVRLGPGTLPEPLHPAWDQLINGSLDTRYVEVQGIVTMTEADSLTLLTRAGKIYVQLPNAAPDGLRHYENALIRVRGCIIPGRNADTQQVELGRLRLSNYSVTVDEPAPADPFDATLKRTADLLLFDSRAGAIQRVKLAGQVVHVRQGEYFLLQGGTGLRFVPKAPVDLLPGDLVEVVGFPELGGPSPVLHEAIARRIGHASLPQALPLPEESLLSGQHEGTLVRVAARLANVSFNRAEQVLELQAGTRGFLARLASKKDLRQDLLPGSRLELTGVYAGQGGDRASGRDIDSFEILLNSSFDIRVLARPSWWTLRHTLTALASMAFVLLAAVVWITLLRRQVEERSRQLTAEIQLREHTERQRALEEERSRIARDLHDDLGATLTQIRFLSVLESRDTHVPETTRSRMSQVSEKSHEMVTSLDEIVWAVNPANDSLPHLAIYLCQFAEEFFRPTPIRCRLDVADSLPPVPLTSEVRHNLYLAVREALNNIAKHSHAAEVWLRIRGDQHDLRITLEDNGRGFAWPRSAASGKGLANMRQRLETIGGRFECESRPGSGTTCRFWLSLNSSAIHPFG